VGSGGIAASWKQIQLLAASLALDGALIASISAGSVGKRNSSTLSVLAKASSSRTADRLGEVVEETEVLAVVESVEPLQ
jgi:hypothetical protein